VSYQVILKFQQMNIKWKLHSKKSPAYRIVPACSSRSRKMGTLRAKTTSYQFLVNKHYYLAKLKNP
jgi:hypothetical protein